VVYTFSPNGPEPPAGNQTLFQGSLYGATLFGGRDPFCSAVYRLAPPAGAAKEWSQSTLYSFGCGDDGGNPDGAVLVLHGVVYGLAAQYGADGQGTAFQLTQPGKPGGSWREETLYTFVGDTFLGVFDGAIPYYNPVAGKHGVLFGITNAGNSTGCSGSGGGTVWRLAPPAAAGGAWTETILHCFSKGRPAGPVVDAGGVLYGTVNPTASGGHGSIFRLVP
jgi:hypothetical protein